jgi:SAM-dependent methyltransferase
MHHTATGALHAGLMLQAILAGPARMKLFGKSPAGIYLRLNRSIWERIPLGLRNVYPLRAYGTWLHGLVHLIADRRQYFGTFFLRNRPALKLMRRLAEAKAEGSTLRITVLACSIGAEVYSILWTIRSARPDLKVLLYAVDISREILNFAERGTYTSKASELVGSSIFERLTTDEMEQIFDLEGQEARIKPWLREGIIWRPGDAASPDLIDALGRQDIVVANNFLCHMEPSAAEVCLRNIAGLVNPDGYLFVSGVDLDIRTRVARELRWQFIPELLEQIHDGDVSLRADWPWCCWGLEPLDRSKPNWQLRYAAVFRIPDQSISAPDRDT